MGIQINGQTDTISSSDGSFTLSGNVGIPSTTELNAAGVTAAGLNVTGVVTATSFSGDGVTAASLNVTGVVTATSFSGDGSGLSNVSPFNWATKTSNYTSSAKDGLFVNTSSGPITITLPSSPSTGDYIHFLDLNGTFATNNLTVARNGNNIIGVASDLIVDINNSGLTLVYTDASNGWKLMYF